MPGKIVIDMKQFNKFQKINLRADKRYDEICKLAEAGELFLEKGQVTARAAAHHQEGMWREEVHYSDGTKEKRIKPAVLVARAEEDGKVELIYNNTEEMEAAKEIAKGILNTWQPIENNICIDYRSDLTEEEILGPPPQPVKAGRKKQIVKVVPL